MAVAGGRSRGSLDGRYAPFRTWFASHVSLLKIKIPHKVGFHSQVVLRATSFFSLRSSLRDFAVAKEKLVVTVAGVEPATLSSAS